MTTTTGSSVIDYLAWVREELEKKTWGSVGITFTICGGQIVDVEKASIDRDHYEMLKKNGG